MTVTSPSVPAGGSSAAPARDATLDVCLATQLFHPSYSGPAIRFRRYAPGLRARGVGMRVFSAGSEAVAEAPEAGTLHRPDSVDGIPVQRVTLPADGGRWERLAVYERALARHCRETRPQLVHFLSLDVRSVPRLLRLRALGVPLVFTETMAEAMSPKPLKRAAQRVYWPLPYRLMDCVVVSSSVMRDTLREIGVRGRVEVIPNGLDLERFRPAPSERHRRELRIRLGLPPDADILLFVGSLIHRKGVDVLAEAWASLAPRYPDAHLVLVGPEHTPDRPVGPQEEFLTTLRATLARAGAPDRLTLTGPVDDVLPYLQAADVMVFPSRKEGMPNVVPEAYGCALPTVMCPFLGLPAEFGAPGSEYLLSERTPAALERHIATLLDDPRRRRELGERARRWAETELDLERSLDRYAELYRELIKRKSREKGQSR